MKNAEIIIIGAGAAGLMAAKELSKARKKVIILEARERVGGRIWPLLEEDFSFQAQAGAEFVHGPAPVTKSLIKEAGLTFAPIEGEIWDKYNGEFVQEKEFLSDKNLLHEKLNELKQDIPIAVFFEEYFAEKKYATLRNLVIKMVEEYDAADPYKISTFSLRDEWLGEEEWQQGKIKEGYGALLDFLKSECMKNGVEINFNQEVTSVEMNGNEVSILCANGKRYDAQKAVITLPLPTLKRISFNPAIPEKITAASKIGFGGAIKILLLFKNQWWVNSSRKDLSKLMFLRSNEAVPIWWTQYPEPRPLLTGWLAGPNAEKLKNNSSDEILDLAFTSLSNIFKVNQDKLKNELINSKVANWPADPFTRGAYSYSTIEAPEAYEELRKPVNNKIFFAGEALFSGNETATVEGALASGLETVSKILNI